MRVSRHITTVAEMNVLIDLKNYGLASGENPLYNLFSELNGNGKGILSLHKAVHPDRLHVVLKGIIEKTISWTLSIISNMRSFLKSRPNSMELLDSRVIAFPYIQAYEFCRYVKHSF